MRFKNLLLCKNMEESGITLCKEQIEGIEMAGNDATFWRDRLEMWEQYRMETEEAIDKWPA